MMFTILCIFNSLFITCDSFIHLENGKHEPVVKHKIIILTVKDITVNFSIVSMPMVGGSLRVLPLTKTDRH